MHLHETPRLADSSPAEIDMLETYTIGFLSDHGDIVGIALKMKMGDQERIAHLGVPRVVELMKVLYEWTAFVADHVNEANEGKVIGQDAQLAAYETPSRPDFSRAEIANATPRTTVKRFGHERHATTLDLSFGFRSGETLTTSVSFETASSLRTEIDLSIDTLANLWDAKTPSHQAARV